MAYDKSTICEIVTSRILVIRLCVLLAYNYRSNPYLAGTLVISLQSIEADLLMRQRGQNMYLDYFTSTSFRKS